ncbi:trypsin-like peptidase domain-containing protein [Streptomyces sp. F63]|uniref:S1C family serine protease n=1 Tax=Streptomyces sp. F63 TaxID=2824887 RepID=UPI001B379AF0|nr:trypsin-like peptidase domain-containing protein [Streptomyces sp. F63]MBQ0983334.1 trypsin-like peptidase domain-containing protein [Streptomyces sp. F63]
MSTENEGAAVPPGTERPAPGAPPRPPSAPPSGPEGPSGGDAAQSDYPLPRPEPGPTAPGRPPEPPAAPAQQPVQAGPYGAGEARAGAGREYGAPDDAGGHASHGAGQGHGGGSAGWPPPPPPPGGAGWGAPGHVPPPPGRPPGRKGRGGVVAAVLAAALVAGGVGGGLGFWAAEQNDGGSTTISAPGDPDVLDRAPDSVAGIAQRALPSVVTLNARGGGQEAEGGTGTGFVYDKEGHILTNNHVVASAADGGKLTATFSNGKEYQAEIVGRAEGYDVAVIKLRNASGADLKPLPLGDSEKKVAVGDATIAIGAPFGLSGTVTTGIISAKNRPVASSDGGSSNASYMSALQTDASINPGNSGGPLLNAQGAVIGINSAIQSAGGGGFGESQAGSIGLGFAIPINQAKRVAENLIETGEPIYPVIGVQVDMRQQGEGARIPESGQGGSDPITDGGPADKAGLKPGDVITKLDDTVIDSGPTLISEIWTHEPGETVKITYERDGKETTVDVTLGQRKGD